MELFLAGAFESVPWLIDVIYWIGFARLVMKPLMTAASSIIQLSPSKKDDLIWAKVLDHKIYKALTFGLDYVASIKLPKKEEKK